VNSMKDYILVTGCGRSGTKWLATLLQLCCPSNVEVYHELSAYGPGSFPKLDFSYLEKRIMGKIQNADYWEEKLSLMEKRLISDVIVEVSSFGQYFLYNYTAPFKVYHLIRHGMGVIRSCLPRRMFIGKALIHHPVPELYGAELENWNSLPRFQKLCWWWKMVNELLEKIALKTYRLEDLISNYHIACQAVKNILGVDLDRRLWSSLVHRRINRTQGPLPDLSITQKQTFLSICGDLLAKYYPESE